MSQFILRRLTQQVDLLLSTAVGASSTISLDGFAGGVVDLGTMSTSATTLQFWAASSPSGTYRSLRKADGSAVELTLSPSTSDGRVYAMPDEVFAVPYLKIVAGSTAASGAAGVVTLKS